jgi:hypothetical protein
VATPEPSAPPRNGADPEHRIHGPADAKREAVRTLALLANDPRTRADLRTYLERAGYQVRLVTRPESRARALVWLAEELEDRQPAAIATVLLSWLAAFAERRAVLVTSRPAAFVELGRTYPDRFSVLAAPVFAWQVVDAIRAPGATP